MDNERTELLIQMFDVHRCSSHVVYADVGELVRREGVEECRLQQWCKTCRQNKSRQWDEWWMNGQKEWMNIRNITSNDLLTRAKKSTGWMAGSHQWTLEILHLMICWPEQKKSTGWLDGWQPPTFWDGVFNETPSLGRIFCIKHAKEWLKLFPIMLQAHHHHYNYFEVFLWR